MGGRSSRRRERHARLVKGLGGAFAALAAVGAFLLLVPGLAGAGPGDAPAVAGSFGQPFEEPTVGGRTTEDDCINRPPQNDAERAADPTHDGYVDCKPAAASSSLAPNGEIAFWNALEGTENITGSIVFEFGVDAINDQSRVLRFTGAGPRFSKPTPVDAGANPGGNIERDPLIPGGGSTQAFNDGSLFCTDQNWLADGRLLTVGGTMYSNDPGVDGSPVGATELQGIKNARIFDPRSHRWTQTGSMNYGRWYPALVTLGNGNLFVASGVEKLLKPVYTPDPTDPDPEPPFQSSGRNVLRSETFGSSTGNWKDNGPGGERSLPLFPRLHLLPNGHVYYNAAGQAFNPFGQAADEGLWNLAASYDPKKNTWKDLGVPGLTDGSAPDPGFRGSTFSVQLPLEPDAKGDYTKARFLTAGGLAAQATPSPGTYAPVKSSRITTVNTEAGDKTATSATGPLHEPSAENEPGDLPNGRWYPAGTLLPTGEVLATAGADRDEVAFPGVEHEVKTAELFDPRSKSWHSVAQAHKPRTYHNTAVLLPDARVLIGGHATITTAYANNSDIPGAAPNGHDPSFEVYSPPYLFRGPRPKIIQADSKLGYGGTMDVETDTPADQIESVVLVRNASTTHVVDADQRNVELQIVKRSGKTVTVKRAPNGNVAPPGPYLLFANKRTAKGLIPSVAGQVSVSASGPSGDARSGTGHARTKSTTRKIASSPDTAAVAVRASTTTPQGDLPFTGLELVPIALAGVMLLAGGALLLSRVRRKRAPGRPGV